MIDRAANRAGITLAPAELRAAHAAQGRVIIALETVLEARLQQGLNALPAVAAPIREHRPGRALKIDNDQAEWRAPHGSGNPSRLDTDSEHHAFVLDRIGTLTYDQIVPAVVATSPPDRRTS